MLNNARPVAFVATSRPEISRQFYGERLKLKLLEETPHALVFESMGTVIRIQKTEQVFPPPYTSLGWEVDDIRATVRALSESGVRFEQFEGLVQDDAGIWELPGGSRVAWFKDPDGNLLSLTQTA